MADARDNAVQVHSHVVQFANTHRKRAIAEEEEYDTSLPGFIVANKQVSMPSSKRQSLFNSTARECHAATTQDLHPSSMQRRSSNSDTEYFHFEASDEGDAQGDVTTIAEVAREMKVVLQQLQRQAAPVPSGTLNIDVLPGPVSNGRCQEAGSMEHYIHPLQALQASVQALTAERDGCQHVIRFLREQQDILLSERDDMRDLCRQLQKEVNELHGEKMSLAQGVNKVVEQVRQVAATVSSQCRTQVDGLTQQLQRKVGPAARLALTCTWDLLLAHAAVTALAAVHHSSNVPCMTAVIITQPIPHHTILHHLIPQHPAPSSPPTSSSTPTACTP